MAAVAEKREAGHLLNPLARFPSLLNCCQAKRRLPIIFGSTCSRPLAPHVTMACGSKAKVSTSSSGHAHRLPDVVCPRPMTRIRHPVETCVGEDIELDFRSGYSVSENTVPRGAQNGTTNMSGSGSSARRPVNCCRTRRARQTQILTHVPRRFPCHSQL